MFELKFDNTNAGKIEYDKINKKTACVINGKSFHVYQIRKENLLTFFGYLICLISKKWEQHSYKGQTFLIKKSEVDSFKKEIARSVKRSLKEFKKGFTNRAKLKF